MLFLRRLGILMCWPVSFNKSLVKLRFLSFLPFPKRTLILKVSFLLKLVQAFHIYQNILFVGFSIHSGHYLVKRWFYKKSFFVTSCFQVSETVLSNKATTLWLHIHRLGCLNNVGLVYLENVCITFQKKYFVGIR